MAFRKVFRLAQLQPFRHFSKKETPEIEKAEYVLITE